MKQRILPMNLQDFAENPAGGDGPGSGSQSSQQEQQTQGFAFDYEKLASIVAGKQTVTEDTVLKNYFKQQGLSQEEAAQAMQQFKDQKAKDTPDVEGIQTQLTQVQALARREALEKAAILEAVGLGLDAKTIPYILKMADLSEAAGQDGKIDNETLKNAINKVLEDIPQLKPAQEAQKGFQVGGIQIRVQYRCGCVNMRMADGTLREIQGAFPFIEFIILALQKRNQLVYNINVEYCMEIRSGEYT